MDLEDDSSSTENEFESSSVEQEERKSPEICQETQESAQKDDQQPSTSKAGQEKEQNSGRSKYSDEDLFAFLKDPKLLKAYELPTLTLTNDTKTWKTVNEKGISRVDSAYLGKRKKLDRKAKKGKKSKKKAKSSTKKTKEDSVHSPGLAELSEPKPVEGGMINQSIGENLKDIDITVPEPTHASALIAQLNSPSFGIAQRPQVVGRSRKRKNKEDPKKKYTFECLKCKETTIYSHSHKYTKMWYHAGRHIKEEFGIPRYTCELCPFATYGKCLIRPHMVGRHGEEEAHKFIDHRPGWSTHLISELSLELYGDRTALFSKPVNDAPPAHVPPAPDIERELEAAFPTMAEMYPFLDVLEASHQADLEEMESDEDFSGNLKLSF